MTIINVSRAATPDEISAEMDRRGAAIEKLETDLRHWREECGKLHAQLDTANEKLRLANTGGLPLLYDIRRELGWNDKTSLSILADGVRRVRRALQTWDTPTGMNLEALALSIKARVVDLEKANVDNKTRIADQEDDRRQDLKNAFVAGYCAALTWTKSGMPQDDLDEAGLDYAASVIATGGGDGR